MTNYRRLISYIYAYEGEAKGKNIGFAKLESRNGQCKLSVNVKKVYVGSSDLGVYLLAPGKEIFLGSIFIRGGSGEFRAAVAVDNAADSGCSMDQCYGLTIHEKGESWRAYTTIWEDAVAQAAELELAGVTSESRGNPDEQIHKKMKELDRELKAQENASAKTSMEEPDFEPEIIDIPADTEVEEPEGDGPVVEEPEGDGSVVEEPDRSEGGSLPGERAWTAQPEGRDGSQPAEVFRSGDRMETGKGGNARYRISEGRTAEEVQAEEAGESRPEAWTTGEARAEEGNQWENQGEAGGEGASRGRNQEGAGAEGASQVRNQGEAKAEEASQEWNQGEAGGEGITAEEIQAEAVISGETCWVNQGGWLSGQEESANEVSHIEEIGREYSDVQYSETQEEQAVERQWNEPGDGEIQSAQEAVLKERAGAVSGGISMNDAAAALMAAIASNRATGISGASVPVSGQAQNLDTASESGPAGTVDRASAEALSEGSEKEKREEEVPDEEVSPGSGRALAGKGASLPHMSPAAGALRPAGGVQIARMSPMAGGTRSANRAPATRMPTAFGIRPNNGSQITRMPPSSGAGRPMGGASSQVMPPTSGAGRPMGGESSPGRMPASGAGRPMGRETSPGMPPSSGAGRPMGGETSPGMPPSSGTGRPMGGETSPGMPPSSGTGRPMGGETSPGMPPSSGADRPMGGELSPGMPRTSGAGRPMGGETSPGMPPSSGTGRPMGGASSPGMPRTSGAGRPMGGETSPGMPPSSGAGRPMGGESSSGMPPSQTAAMPQPALQEQPPVVDAGEEAEALPLGDPRELARLEEEEQEYYQPQQLWEDFRKRYPKIQAFDSANGCEILTIKPQDIGLLPRENWNYGNNSFLLHGYYNYRYLVLARIGGDGGSRIRYILGVPGHYYSNEKYMASMFGFPHFVLSKKQPSQDGRFGYWYTDIRLLNQD